MSKISIIAAVDRRMAIGFENKLLFWLPNDLKRFKALTTEIRLLWEEKLSNHSPKAPCQPQECRSVFKSGCGMSGSGSIPFTRSGSAKLQGG